MSVPSFIDVRLEIVRPGSPHNQLLSPLTPYMALCGEGSPITFHIDFEHQQLLTRLERLRYHSKSGQRLVSIPQRLREAEVSELGSEVARILSAIQTLSTELARAQSPNSIGSADAIVHLRLVFAGSELSLIPFEMAIAPIAYPGEGLEFCLQGSLPIVVTREIRRSRPMPVSWDQSSRTDPKSPDPGSRTAPKVLVVYAEPEGLQVPAKAHIQAIRMALEPWIRRVPAGDRVQDADKDANKRLPSVKERLRLLPNASVESIYEMCSRERFTHVHILAHGDTYEHAGETRFGVALCRDGSRQQKEVVSGNRLAKALQAEDAQGTGRSEPLLVTLATCDSGNQMSVLAPGGSIAHDLHSEGIPWVVASQFPLTVPGSVRMAEILYPRLLRGDDPRQVLFELRRQLFLSAQGEHDWASLVAYATLPRDFAHQVEAFASHQIKAAIEVSLAYADSVTVGGASKEQRKRQRDEIEASTREVEELLHTWNARMPEADSVEHRLRRAEIKGMHGATYKRIALLHAAIEIEDEDREEKKKRLERIEEFYGLSLDNYRDTMGEASATNQKYYWSATQYLSLQARRAGPKEPDTHQLALRLAWRDVTAKNSDDDTKAWAHATIAELVLLSTYHTNRPENAVEQVRDNCRAIVALTGINSFYVGSTRRQFKRYRDCWKIPAWEDLAKAAIEILEPPPPPKS